jgi:phospholipase A2
MNRAHCIVLLFCVVHCVKADTITVFNHAHVPVYVSIYSVQSNLWGTSTGPAYIQSPVVLVPAHEYAALERPAPALKAHRELIFSKQSSDLGKFLDIDAYKKASCQRAGWIYGSVYHIAEYENTLHGYTEGEWQIIKPVSEVFDNVTDAFFEKLQGYYSEGPYSTAQAKLRIGSDICQEELGSVAERVKKVNVALSEVLQQPIELEKTPRVAVCLSGGGMRAAMASYGLMAGLDDIGLLNGVTYCAGLSGSTWFLADWMVYGGTLKNYYEHFTRSISSMRVFSVDSLAASLWPKYVFRQDIGIVDVYGVYLANTLFSTIKNKVDRQRVTFSSLAHLVRDGSLPFPLCTGVETSIDNHWVTFTPFEVSCDSLGFSMPTWAFGRKFVNGASVDFAPEPSLGFLMGLWGSALSGSVQEMLDTTVHQLNPVLYNTVSKLLLNTGLSELRIASIKIKSPLYGLETHSYRDRNLTDLIFMDAGYAYNLPLPPLFKKERGVNVVIILDVSEGVYNGAGELKKAMMDLKESGFDVPTIDFSMTSDNPVKVYRSNNPSIPTLVYVVPLKQKSYDPDFDPKDEFNTTYRTSRFSYDKKSVDKLTGLIRHTIKTYKESILGAIKDTL